MSKTLKYILTSLSTKYELKVINNIHANYIIDTVRIIEHMDSVQHIKENELIITTGIMLRDEDNLLQFCKLLIKQHAHGLIINIGPYIEQIPKQVLKLCDGKLPLITLPWEKETIDLEKSIYELLMKASESASSAAEFFEDYMKSPDKRSILLNQLEALGFSRTTKYALFMISVTEAAVITEQQMSPLQIHADSIGIECISYYNNNVGVFALANCSDMEIRLFETECKRICKRSQNTLFLTIGPRSTTINTVSVFYQQLYSRAHIAYKYNLPITKFTDIDLLGLLSSLSESVQLDNIYNQYYGRLKRFDETQHTNYCNVLENYFDCNFNKAELSQKLYIHRNTVHYQLNKIEEILNCDLKNPHDITCLYLSFLQARFFNND